ncbi:MAG: ORF6N domain-containing protein [Mangrovibacterium sp.]
MELSVIQSKIYEIRGVRVMLDFDLAEMYGVETKRLKETVKRNIERFEGDDFMFELTVNEIAELSRSQFATLNKGRGHNIKYAPFAFPELGVSMLSSVLRSKAAIEINRNIMRAFAAVRTYIAQHASMSKEIEDLWKAINDLGEDNQKEFDDIYLALSELAAKQKQINQSSNIPKRAIGFVKPKK